MILQLDDDFGGFGSAQGGQQQDAGDVESFLARERAALGEDADVFGGAPATSGSAPGGTNGPALLSDEEHQPEAPTSSSGRFDVSDFSRDEPQSNVHITGTDEMSAFEQQYPDVQSSPAQPVFTVSSQIQPFVCMAHEHTLRFRTDTARLPMVSPLPPRRHHPYSKRRKRLSLSGTPWCSNTAKY